MSLVGTRPILQDELQKYELHHRATGTGESRNCSLYTFKPAVLSLQSDLFETIFGFKKSNGYMCCEETTEEVSNLG